MKILLLGGSGQVGWELQRSLETLGTVTAASRASVDLLDTKSIVHVVESSRPDVIVNAAAYTAVDEAEALPERADAINHRAVAVLAGLAAELGIWLVHYSSDYVFDGHGTQPFGETDRTEPLSAYGRSKAAGDKAIAASGCHHLILRASWIHAPRGRNFVRTVLDLAGKRDTLRVVADQQGAPTSAELVADTTAALLQLALDGDAASGVYHLASAGETSWYDMARLIVGEAGRLGVDLRLKPDAIAPIATADYPTAAVRPLNSRLDTRKLRATTGQTLPEWQAGIKSTIAGLVAA